MPFARPRNYAIDRPCAAWRQILLSWQLSGHQTGKSLQQVDNVTSSRIQHPNLVADPHARPLTTICIHIFDHDGSRPPISVGGFCGMGCLRMVMELEAVASMRPLQASHTIRNPIELMALPGVHRPTFAQTLLEALDIVYHARGTRHQTPISAMWPRRDWSHCRSAASAAV